MTYSDAYMEETKDLGNYARFYTELEELSPQSSIIE